MSQKLIKEQLPDVVVRIDGVNYIGRVRGRKERFATVDIEIRPNTFSDYEFSWEAIEHHLRTGMPLRA